jgi:chaperone BCS1
MIEQLTKFFNNNQLFSGGAFLLLGGSVMALFWKGYGYFITLVNYLFFVQINFCNIDDAFKPMQTWLFNHKYTRKRCSNLMVRNIRRYNKDLSDNNDDQQIFIPSYGTHYFFVGWRPTILSYTKTEDKDAYTVKEYINIKIFCLFQKLKFAERIVQETAKIFKKSNYNETLIYTCIEQYGEWHMLLKKKIKQQPILESPEAYNLIIDDIQKFLNNEKWYADRGINYKRGLLFAGPPGGGKTSCILSLAQYFKRHVYIINLSSENINDNKFMELVTSLPKDAILAIEDLGEIKKAENKDEKTKNKITLSTVLNVLDGLLTPERLIFIITTNHPDSLDEALKRPGRIDLYKEFPHANTYQTRTIYKRFFPESSQTDEDEFVKENTGKSMSQLENELIKLTK